MLMGRFIINEFLLQIKFSTQEQFSNQKQDTKEMLMEFLQLPHQLILVSRF